MRTPLLALIATFMASPVAFAATETHGEEASKGLPQFDPTWFPSQIFWLLVMYVVLYVVFARKTLPALSGVIDNRNNLIESEMEEAERLTTEATTVQEDYEGNLATARQKATETTLDVEQAIRDKATQVQNDFRARAEKDMNKLEKTLTKAKEETMGELETIVADLTSKSVKKLAGVNIKSSEVEKIIGSLNANNSTRKAA